MGSAGAPYTAARPNPAIGQMGSVGTIPLNVWGPFAGYGTRGRHVAWLLNDQGERADQLLATVRQRFADRTIPSSATGDAILKRQGLLVDARPFTLIARGITTVGLYIARFGKDLYVSQVTYFKSPISNLRIAILAVMVLFALVYPGWLASTLSGLGRSVSTPFGGSSPDLGGLVFLTCILGPMAMLDYLALTIFVIASAWKWLTEKDILALLRERPNEFDFDDITALERATEQTVRESLDTVGIDRQLMPPAPESSMRWRLI